MSEQNHETKSIESSREQRVAELAAEKALHRFAKEHACRFTKDEAHILHALVDANGGINANHVKLLVWAAKILDNAALSVGRLFMWGLLTAVVFGLYLLFKIFGKLPS
jgi:hypothetical protein